MFDVVIFFSLPILSEASHGKLMLQAEQAIKTQLNDAERRITMVHKVNFFSYNLNSVTRAILHPLLCFALYILIKISIMVMQQNYYNEIFATCDHVIADSDC